ncbi:gamma carbonic anhydrase [Macrococcus equipercicus]|uniref:Gamma carbonic anhydrase family protein n=1 Tax=Macrococcus equipercicus TaxID=69967 RepID=A0A9Q9F0U7_9STAP|nr:gamma carbonic anhydrase family protein [Macrococcus equipercicus]KAA1038385.1 gamma carbonic anhydrase family protein [Macrococcus equipercicus]UTH13227.1 gamma carbonic anhydrase family protein [Macrococcus equipercicus]
MELKYNGHRPNISDTAFIAPTAVITGDVTVGDHASVWYGTVIRGDVSPVIIGSQSNVQDLCCLHQSPDKPLIIEDCVTIGHRVTLHSCTIKENALVGMDSTILDGAEIGEYAFIGAGSLVPPGKKIPPRTLAFGRPAQVVRELNDHDYSELERIYRSYVDKGQQYKAAHTE